MKKTIILAFYIFISALGFTQTSFFNQADTFFKSYVQDQGVDYKALSASREVMKPMVDYIAQTDFANWDNETQKAYLINAYNLLVISKLKNNYPVMTPMDIPNFFDQKDVQVNNDYISLNYLEKTILFGLENDPRFHFVLVCGARGCPPILDAAYRPKTLSAQLESQTNTALNDNNFIKFDAANNSVGLSKIFEWYAKDFGGKKNLLTYINTYRTDAIDMNANVYHYDYDWTINALKNENSGDVTAPNVSSGPTSVGSSSMKKSDPVSWEIENKPEKQKSNVQTYTPSVLLKKGQKDITWFNTIYTQNKSRWMGTEFSGFRETFFTSLFQFTYGISQDARINVGLDINFQTSGKNDTDDSFSQIGRAFEFENNENSRSALSSIAPRIKIAPFRGVNFSLESSFSIPTASSPEGTDELYFLAWDRYIWWNRFYFDKTIGKFQIFTEADALFRLRKNKNQYNALDVPVSLFFSYFVNDKTTFYVMGQHVERFRITEENPEINDAITTPANYSVYGFGGKYQLNSKLNLELLFTDFFRSKNAGLGETYNIGLKYIFN